MNVLCILILSYLSTRRNPIKDKFKKSPHQYDLFIFPKSHKTYKEMSDDVHLALVHHISIINKKSRSCVYWVNINFEET